MTHAHEAAFRYLVRFDLATHTYSIVSTRYFIPRSGCRRADCPQAQRRRHADGHAMAEEPPPRFVVATRLLVRRKYQSRHAVSR